jgi:competence protein ComEC
MKRKVAALLISLCFIISFTGCSPSDNSSGSESSVNGDCIVHFIDIGQGDATLVQIGDTNSLIDTGTSAHYDDLSEYLDNQNVDEIDNLIVTHPDADHMGSAYKVIEDYQIEHFYTSNTTNSSQAYTKMIQALKKKSIEKEVLSAGDSIDLGEGSEANLLGPIGSTDDKNESSLVIRLDYGDTSFLFTGDTTARMENKMNEKYDIDVDVLKVSHHGSDTASGVMFVRDTSPIYSVISVGANNSYGHPDKNVLRRLEKYTTGEVLRTDQKGSIQIVSDGKELSVTTGDGTSTKAKTSTVSSDKDANTTDLEKTESETLIGNKNTKIYHSQEESNLPAENNREYFSSVEEAENAGYRACQRCMN